MDWELLEPLIRRLLRHMHGRKQADLADLCHLVWEKDSECVTTNAVNTAVSKANHFLKKRQSTQWLEKVRGETIIRWV